MTRRMLFLGILLLGSTWGWTQVYQDGVQTGMVKVKFTTEMSAPLSQLRVQSGKKLVTGIQTLDAVATKTGAKNMYRLFPYDPKFENKLRKHGLHLWYVVEIDNSINPKTAAQQFRQLKEVAVAETEREKILAPYALVPYSQSPSTFTTLPFNDPYLKDQWHYNNTGQSGFADADVNLFEAWTETAGASDIIVSVHDEGVDVNHIDIKDNMWTNAAELNGTTGVDDDNNGYIDDIHGYNFQKNKGAVDAQPHGTHVAGTIAAINNNGIGVSGVAGGTGHGDGVKVMSLQIFGGAFENSYIYAANNGAVISQNSWGYRDPGTIDESVLEAIDYFIAEAGDYPGSPMKGGIVIFAAGNSNMDAEWYPGYHEPVMAVSSLGPEWKRAYYSNYGSWVEIAAPGGDLDYGSKGGVLSLAPKNQYAYMQGTSMACPHVSGIAALALANRTKQQLTNTELWNKLMTGTVDIDQFNPDYAGKLGVGAIDASLAIQNDLGIAPVAIADLAVTGVAQEFATLSWTVPVDTDDKKPTQFNLYYHTQAITSSNINTAEKIVIKNDSAAGKSFEYEVAGLLGLTTYHFVITSTDRWGNVSVLSNPISATTNNGPSIVVDENSTAIELSIDVTVSETATHEITISNQEEGILRWDHFTRHRDASLSFSTSGLHYPKVTSSKPASEITVGRRSVVPAQNIVRSNEPVPMAFTAVEKSYSSWATDIIGEMDIRLSNSAAAKFFVNEPEGFNLTQVQMYLKHDPELGPVIVEVYKGSAPVKNNLVYAQEHSNWGAREATAYITLDEQLYFASGETFWVVFHVPAGNLYPLGIGFENDPSYSANCFMSFDMGATWDQLEVLLDSKDFAWTMTAASYNAHLGTYLTLEPGSGDIAGHEEAQTVLTANGANLINGTYSANLVLKSNDANQRELRVPVTLNVSGHEPHLKHIDIVDFGNVFNGLSETIEVALENTGYGNFSNPEFSIDNPQFSIVGGTPWKIGAREEAIVKIKFSPVSGGNINGLLKITNGEQSYEIPLFGVGAETSRITITPESQTVNSVTIGDVVDAQITVENTGAFPLKYFVPGYDNKGISDNWPSDYHSYGYKFRTSYASESNPIAYSFQDISSTGVNVTETLKDDGVYVPVELGFDFPYYGQMMHKIFIAQKGFTTFDDSVRPINSPSLNNTYNPKGFISPLGGFFSFVTSEGSIHYQVEADRIIIQYNNVWDGWNPEFITAQMVLFANGDIRFYYEDMGYSAESQKSLNILIENLEQNDGILVNNYSQPIELYSGLALGFDYPGPNIITSMENGSGIIVPGGSTVVDVKLDARTLVEGTTKRYINFISNDPSTPQTSALIQLEITDGGVTRPVVSTDTIAFGNVFQGAVRSSAFTIKNTGSANLNVTGMNLVDGEFTITGEASSIITPGMYKKYEVQVPTADLGSMEDWLSINYADGTHDTIAISGNIVVAPAISVDLTPIQETLAYGESLTHTISIGNTGLAPLEVSASGNQWLLFEATDAIVSHGYTVEKNNNGDFYQWIDIRKTGTQMPFVDFDDFDATFWRTLELPFPIEFYGEQFTSFKIGDNGIISFEENPEASLFTDYIPSAIHPGKCIMPYWTFSGFSDYLYPIEDIGIFYQFYDDKFIITWSYFTNNFGGMGDPVSAQVIFYKNGTMKFQYKREEGGADLTSHFGTIGFQESSSKGVGISEYNSLDYGAGLAYIITPVKKYVVQPGETLEGNITLDATNMYGGHYTGVLKIENNVPNQEHLEKPVELTVTGDAVIDVVSEVDFGKKIIEMEFGSPKLHTLDLTIGNEGSAPLEITWAQMTDGMQGLSMQIWAYVDGWFGKEWRWADIAELYSPWSMETPVFTIKPGDALDVRAVFAPSAPGEFADDLVLITNAGEKHIAMTGSAVDPPSLHVTTESIDVTMSKPDETETASVEFDNLNGLSDLIYEVSIDYGRAVPARAESMTVAAQLVSTLKSVSTRTGVGVVEHITSTYNRVLSHTEKDAPDTYVGTDGATPFTVATKFNAGPEGFNVSHIEAWFRTEALTQGVITAEVRAGGNSIAEAATLATGSIEFTGTGNDEVGAWYTITLDVPAGIYPNEDFYILVNYPFGMNFPVGTVTGEEHKEGRYLYSEDGGLWGDAQEIEGFGNFGWLMSAAEQTAKDFKWVTLTSGNEGILPAGESGTIGLLIDGALAVRGDQVASVVLKSNDPANTMVKIPVTLHLNDAPHFFNVPVNVVMAENEQTILKLNVTDAEDDAVMLSTLSVYEDVDYVFEGGVLTITLTPEFGDAGNYSYVFVATDEHNASREVTVSVEVTHTNQAPEFIASQRVFDFHATSSLNEFSLGEFFADPDDDEMTFTVTSTDDAVDVFASADQFIVRPVSIGEAYLIFTVKDSHQATTVDSIQVVVSSVLALEEESMGGMKVYPNAVQKYVNLSFSKTWKGELAVEVVDAAGKIQLTTAVQAAENTSLDLSGLRKGFYILRVSDADKHETVKIIKE
ncbi:MAG TPA: S8 family serine peptidase [Ohtaekwangia sp.]